MTGRCCTCENEGPSEWCDIHGLPSAAHKLGLAQGRSEYRADLDEARQKLARVEARAQAWIDSGITAPFSDALIYGRTVLRLLDGPTPGPCLVYEDGRHTPIRDGARPAMCRCGWYPT